MTEENKTEVLTDDEVKEKKEEKKEKKENAFSKFWNKAKTNINNAVLENNIESEFNNNNYQFVIYQKNETFSSSYYGDFESDAKEAVCLFGEREIKPFSVIIDQRDKKAYYVKEVSECTVKATVEGTEYERKGTRVTLDKNVEEVNVIKAGNRFFLYKGTEE